MIAQEETRLATIMHISDLHFGDMDKTSDSTLDSHAEKWWRAHRIFDGYLGHSGIALRQFSTFFGEVLEEENAFLFISGDITSVGSRSQFEFADRYFQGTARLPSGRYFGLGLHNGLMYAVPGNHDHWPGKTATWPYQLVMIGGPTAAFHRAFPGLPKIIQIPLKMGKILEVIGIDTDAQTPSIGRCFARGKFDAQLRQAQGRLGPIGTDRIRVLLMHHSRMHGGFTLGITRRSRRALRDFIQQNKISVLLTGHMHLHDGDLTSVLYRGSSWDVLEARCGTTTQRDEPPLGWTKHPLPQNSLLVHRLVAVGSTAIEWRPTLYERKLQGFVESSSVSASGRKLGDVRVVVWP